MSKLDFQPITVTEDRWYIAKPLHHAKPMIVKPITDLGNLSLSTSTFPDSLKTAQVAHIHQKK